MNRKNASVLHGPIEKAYRLLWPVMWAILFHITVFSGSLTLPQFLHNRPLEEEIYTIDLISMPEVEVAPVKKEPQAKPKKIEPKPEPVKKTEETKVQIPEKPEAAQPEVSPKLAKPISLKPLKRKIRKAKDLRLVEDKERDRRLRQKKLAERKRAEDRRKRELAKVQRQENQARKAALEATRNLIRESAVQSKQSNNRSAANSRGKQLNNIVLQQYLSALFDRIHRYWILPEMKKWENNLEAIVVMTINRDGSVTHLEFEKQSQDPYYDQFVKKTIEDASPMPRFSKLMKQNVIEVGLRFRPGELSL